VNETAATGEADAAAQRRERMFAIFRLVLEFAFLFTVTVAAKELLAAAVPATYPNLLWLPVAVLTLQNGFGSGLAAAIIATGLQYATGLPPELLGEDIYNYIGRIAAEPIAWTCFALIFGHIRSRQIAHAAEIEAQLVQRNEQCAAVAELCDDLRRRTAVLERQIAAAGQSSSADMAQAIIELHQAGWDDFADRLRRFVVLVTGCPAFAVHLLRTDVLAPALQPADEHRSGMAGPISRGDPLFEAIVNERRILSARRPADRTVLAERAVMAGPIAAAKSPQDGLVGMFSVGGASPDDCSEDLARRFSLALSELSRLAGRLMLIGRWQTATAGTSNGQGQAEGTQIAAPGRGTDEPLRTSPPEPARQAALQ
jgi:hypothetical protein